MTAEVITLPVVARILSAPFAVLAPMNAVIATAAGMNTDATVWLLVAIFAALVVIAATRAIRRNEAEQRRQMSEYREAWFGSFERRRRMRQGPTS